MNYNVNLDAYVIFMEVYETKNLTKAAENLNLSQPTISYRIKKLEDILGIKLFNRTNKGIETTIFADELYKNIKKSLENLKIVERELIEKKENGIGHIYIGVQHHISKYFLTPILKKYNKTHPNVRIHIISKGTNELVRLLDDGKVDFILDTLPITSEKRMLKIIKIKELETCFAKLKNSENKFIFPVVGSTMRTELDRILQLNDINIEPEFEVYTTEMTIEMIKEEMGIGYTIKDFLLHDIQENIDFIKIVEPLPKLVLCVAYVNYKQPDFVNDFFELIEDEVKMSDIY